MKVSLINLTQNVHFAASSPRKRVTTANSLNSDIFFKGEPNGIFQVGPYRTSVICPDIYFIRSTGDIDQSTTLLNLISFEERGEWHIAETGYREIFNNSAYEAFMDEPGKGLARTLLKQGKYAEALDILKETVKKAPAATSFALMTESEKIRRIFNI